MVMGGGIMDGDGWWDGGRRWGGGGGTWDGGTVRGRWGWGWVGRRGEGWQEISFDTRWPSRSLLRWPHRTNTTETSPCVWQPSHSEETVGALPARQPQATGCRLLGAGEGDIRDV